MTVENCMTLVDTLVPNAVPTTLKQRWLAELEGFILTDVRHHDPETLEICGEPGEVLFLSVPFPYDRVYWTYLAAMVDYYHGDITRYEESSQLFDHAMEDYAKWYQRERRC